MTLGNRLYDLRTKRGLSQQELAEALDVSRQSVSKWETDAAVPEIDKLIAVSKYFGVPIGALLGVEEGAPPAPENELSDAQLKMVEEIAARYVAALPKPMSLRRRVLMKVAICVAVICLGVGLSRMARHIEQLDSSFSSLSFAVENVRQSVGWQIDGVTRRVEEILKTQNDLTADYDVEVASIDPRGGTATFLFRVTPKTFTEGMTAWLEVEDGGERRSVGPFAPQGQTFAGEITAALTDDVALYVVFETEGRRETQLLDRYSDLFTGTLPLLDVFFGDSLVFEDVPDGVLRKENWIVPLGRLTYNETAPTAVPFRRAKAKRVELGFFQNRRLVAWAEALDGTPEGFYGFEEGTVFYRFPSIELPLAAGDELALVLRVTDEYDRVMMWLDGGERFLVSRPDGAGALRLDYSVGDEPLGWSDPSAWGIAPE